MPVCHQGSCTALSYAAFVQFAAVLALQFLRLHQPGSQSDGGEGPRDMLGTVGYCRGPRKHTALL